MTFVFLLFVFIVMALAINFFTTIFGELVTKPLNIIGVGFLILSMFTFGFWISLVSFLVAIAIGDNISEALGLKTESSAGTPDTQAA